MASDSAATFGAGGMFTIGQQAVRKLVKVNNHILCSGTGAIGVSQMIADTVARLWSDNKIKGTPESAMDTIGRAINALVRPYLEAAAWQRNITGEAAQSLCKSLVALPVDKKPCLLSFDFNGIPERATAELPFVAMGSGQMIADPFLAFLRRVLWKSTEPTLAEGRLAAVWTIDHVRRTHPGGVGGDIQLASLVPKGAGLPEIEITPGEGAGSIQEHLVRVTSAEQVLVDELRGVKPADAPVIPQPQGQ